MPRRIKDLQMYKKKELVYSNIEESIKDNKILALKLLSNYDFNNSNGSNNTFIINQVIQPLGYFIERAKITREISDLEEAYKGFCEIIDEINKYIVFTPTITTFCKYINISSQNFSHILAEANERGETMRKIKDGLSEHIMQNMMNSRINPIAGIFVSKANFGMKDNEGTNVNILNVSTSQKSLDDILNEYKLNKK